MVGSPVTIVDGSTAAPTVNQSIQIALPSTLNGGKVYFLIQSVAAGDASGLFDGVHPVITAKSDINWTNAQSSDFRYDSFEVSLLGLAGDAGNLTDVNVFGIPMAVEISYPNGGATQTRGYKVDGSTIFSDVATINGGALVYNYEHGPLSTPTRREPAGGGADDGGGGRRSSGRLGQRLARLRQSLGAAQASDIEIAGYFNGAYSVEWTTYNGTAYQYNEYHNPGGSIVHRVVGGGRRRQQEGQLCPDADLEQPDPGRHHHHVGRSVDSIYSTLGSATVAYNGTDYTFTSQTAGVVSQTPDMNTGANNEWGATFVKFLTGFIAGYLGGTAPQLNPPAGSETIDLNKNWNYDPTFAFHAGGMTHWTWDSSAAPVGYGAGVSFDPYADIFFNNTNSYGYGYSDALMSLFQQGGPLVSTGSAGRSATIRFPPSAVRARSPSPTSRRATTPLSAPSSRSAAFQPLPASTPSSSTSPSRSPTSSTRRSIRSSCPRA